MYTYNLTFNDNLLAGAKRSFPSETAITVWMQQQIERMLKQISIHDVNESKPLRDIKVSERIKALSDVPPSSSNVDYKEELFDVLSEKY